MLPVLRCEVAYFQLTLPLLSLAISSSLSSSVLNGRSERLAIFFTDAGSDKT